MTSKTYGITPEQLDACTRVIDEKTGEVFYIVQSASDPTVSYQVRYSKQFNRLSCQCKGNQKGRTCWHLRAALMHSREYAELKKAEDAARKRQEEEETLKRVMNAKPAHYTEEEIQRDLKRYAPHPFSILR